MNLSIRHITEFNEALIRTFFEELGESQIHPNKRFFEDPKNILLAAYADQEIAGLLWAYLLEAPDEASPEIFLYSVDVAEKFRRRGVGSQMIQEIKKIAKEKGCRGMFVLTNKSNPIAMALYEKNGGLIDKGDDLMYDFEV